MTRRSVVFRAVPSDTRGLALRVQAIGSHCPNSPSRRLTEWSFGHDRVEMSDMLPTNQGWVTRTVYSVVRPPEFSFGD